MTVAAIREKLHDYIKVADGKKIKAIYTLLEEDLTKQYDWSQDEDFVAELDERVRRYEAGIDRGYTLDEVKASLKQLKESRSRKLVK